MCLYPQARPAMACFLEAPESTSISTREKIFWTIVALWMAATVIFVSDLYPVLGTISISVFFAIWLYCWWYRKNENPPFKPPGGGKLLFAGAFTDKTHRWNVLVDVAIIAFGLFAASHVLNQKLLAKELGGVFMFFSFFIMFFVLFLDTERTIVEQDTERTIKGKTCSTTICLRRVASRRLAENGGTLEWQPSSVYADPSISMWSVLFQVLVPQLVAMVLYVLSFFLSDPEVNTWAVVYAICGAFFGPITLRVLNLPYAIIDNELLRYAPGGYDIVLKKNPTSTRNLGDKVVFDYVKLRYTIHCLLDVVGPFLLVFTLPILLANESGSQAEFVLNAMAIHFVITLDDIPVEKRKTYTCTDPHFDPEAPPPPDSRTATPVTP